MELIPPHEWPKSIAQAVVKLLQVLTPEQQDMIRNTSQGDLIKFHHNLGTWIRNQFVLWGGNKELTDACGGGCPDDCSMVIIEALWRDLQGEVEPPQTL